MEMGNAIREWERIRIDNAAKFPHSTAVSVVTREVRVEYVTAGYFELYL